MRKPDEVEFYNELMRRARDPEESAYPRTLAAELGINENRAYYLCHKWVDYGWADYGVNALACFFTPEAPEWIAAHEVGPPVGEWPGVYG